MILEITVLFYTYIILWFGHNFNYFTLLYNNYYYKIMEI